ncbi:sporulation protein YpjB [Cohnella sp. GCM10027633]|uniref:sporulation protein YpjB n=1 Tax=unclassified Cohnella TaxID=2636738 RepID=UPI003642DE1E
MNVLIRARLLLFVLAAAIVMLLTLPQAATAGRGDGEVSADGAKALPNADVSSSSAEAYASLLRSANRLYAAANDGDTALMSQSLAVIDYRFKLLPISNDDSIDGLQAMDRQLTQIRLSLAVPKPDELRLRKEAAALLLAADAMAKPGRPLWHDYRSVLSEDVDALGRALSGDAGFGGETKPRAALEQLRSDYEAIRTAALFGFQGDTAIARSDAVLRYADTVLREEPYHRELTELLVPSLQDAMLGLFPVPDERGESVLVPAAPGASWAWSAMMGSFIVTVLTWVGWRRYRDEGEEGIPPSAKAPERKDAAERLMERWRYRK